jgi:hypothetical protein
MSAALADPPSGNGSGAGASWERARARRICARALVLALDPTVESSAAATELAALAGGDARAVVRALAFVRVAGARPSPVNDRAERALLLTIAELVPGSATGTVDRSDRDP